MAGLRMSAEGDELCLRMARGEISYDGVRRVLLSRYTPGSSTENVD